MPHEISRRNFVIASASAVTVATNAVSASAAARGLLIRPLSTLETRFFDGGFTRALRADLPVRVAISGATSGNIDLRATFDPRLSTLGDVAVIDVAGEASVRALELHEGGARLLIPREKTLRKRLSPAVDIVVALPFRPLDIYPDDNPSSVQPVSIHVSDDGGSAFVELVPTSIAEVEPWSAEVSARWAEVKLPEGRVYPYPYSVILTGAGPHPIPAGAQLTVHTDERIVVIDDADQILTGTDEDAPSTVRTFAGTAYREAGYSIYVIVLDQTVRPGEAIEVSLRSSLADDPAADALMAYVSLATDGRDADAQRQTGRLTTSKAPYRR